MNQSDQFNVFIKALYDFTEKMNQGIYGAKRAAYSSAPAGPDKQNIFNRPVVLDSNILNDFSYKLQYFNNILQTDPRVSVEAKMPHNARIIKSYYEKIASNLVNIDYRQTPSFKDDMVTEFNRFNNILFGGPNVTLPSFKYPEPLYGPPNVDDTAGEYTDPEEGLETRAASSLKQKAMMAANALRGIINKATDSTELPKKHPGWDKREDYENWNP